MPCHQYGRIGQRAVMALAIAALASACGTVCDDASTICGFETTESSADCADATECASLCIVDWDSCDVNNAEAGVSKCIAQCPIAFFAVFVDLEKGAQRRRHIAEA